MRAVTDAKAPPARSPKRSSRKRRRDPTLSQMERRIVLAITAAAAVVAIFSQASPTGIALIDGLLSAALAALVTLAATRAKRWSLLWLAGVATASAVGDVWIVPGAIALVLCGVAVTQRHRDKILAASIAALAVQSALNIPDVGFFGLPSILAAVAVAPVLWSGYRHCTARGIKLINRSLLGAIAFVGVATFGLGLAVAMARSHVDDGADKARQALVALRAGDQQESGRLFDAARSEFEAGRAAFSAPWAWPSRVVPVVGRQTDALSTAASSGESISGAGARAATAAPYQQLRAKNGKIDVSLLESMQRPVDASADSLRNARTAIRSVQTGWVAPPVSGELEKFVQEIERALPDAEMASEAIRVLPGLLGVNGTQHYFIAIGSPSETRFQGGFMGSYGELTASNGEVRLVRSGSVDELNHAPGAEQRKLEATRVYRERYGRWRPSRFMQNLTAAPDLPANASAIAELYPQAGGTAVDGVIYVDPIGLAALLKLTGPVTVDGIDEPLTTDNVASYLLRDQYLTGKSRTERQDDSTGVAKATFEALTSRELPTPSEIAKALGPATRGGHLLFTATNPAASKFLDRLGTSGRFLDAHAGDYFDVRVANAGGNKIDTYLSTSVDYRAVYDPRSGRVTAVATVELRNDAPATGLPDYIIGNVNNEPPGTSRLYVAAFTPGTAVSVERDGVVTPMESQEEFGGNVYSTLLSIPPGGTTKLELQLDGRLEPGNTYRFQLGHQALASDGKANLTVRGAEGGAPITGAEGFTAAGDRATWSGTTSELVTGVVRFG